MMISPKKKVLLSLLSASILAFSPALFGAATAVAAPAVAGLPDFADIVDRTGPSVVNIRTTERAKAADQSQAGPDDEEMQEFFRRFFGVPVRPIRRAIIARAAVRSKKKCRVVSVPASSFLMMATS